MSDHQATQRFSDRVADYRRYRPRYPIHMARDLLRAWAWPSAEWPTRRIVDVGSGTGFSAAPFLALGCYVAGVEPNDAMRQAAAVDLASPLATGQLSLHTGTAEATKLPANQWDGILAGQAFHWFDPAGFRAECQRLLRVPGPVTLVWNDRDIQSDAFHRDYEALILRHATDYEQINHQNLDKKAFDGFFGAGQWQAMSWFNAQFLDYAGLLGRLESSSYIPAAGSPGNDAMREELHALFRAHEHNGHLTLRYSLRAWWGSFSPA